MHSKSALSIDIPVEREVAFFTDSDSFLETPEITDAKLTELSWTDSKVDFYFQINRKTRATTYRITAKEIVFIKISNLEKLNITMSLFISNNLAGRDMEIEMIQLVTSSGQQYDEEEFNQGVFFFGNEPSCGCQIYVICRSLRIFELDKS
jgi:hypothetical protein